MPADILVGESMTQYKARKAAAPMKTFAGIKTLGVIKAQCKALGIQFDDRLYRRTGSDFVVIRSFKNDSHRGEVLFSSFNGNFFGTTDTGVQFDSKSPLHEGESWFQTLLSFFYIETVNTAAA